MEILIATYNLGKIREVSEALSPLPITVRTLDEFSNIEAVAETGDTYAANAVLKAVGYANQTGVLALADDSGLEVEALGGQPGVLSARFGGEGASDEDRIQKLLTMTFAVPAKARGARFVCCMAVAQPETDRSHDNGLLTVIEKHCEGALTTASRGTNGFGYDPIFIPSSYTETFGELSSEIKSKISHRGQALTAVRAFLIARLASNLTEE